jgi:aspartyl/asparaginyl-tRNA synthetase
MAQRGPAPVGHADWRQHSLGLERTIIYATGMANIRDVIPFPRTPA